MARSLKSKKKFKLIKILTFEDKSDSMRYVYLNVYLNTFSHSRNISNISFVHHQFSQYFFNSWKKVWNFVEEKVMGIFTKTGITFSYGIEITKFLARWKYCYQGYVVTWSRDYFGFYIVSSSCDLRKGLVHAFGFLLWCHMSIMDRVHLWS